MKSSLNVLRCVVTCQVMHEIGFSIPNIFWIQICCDCEDHICLLQKSVYSAFVANYHKGKYPLYDTIHANWYSQLMHFDKTFYFCHLQMVKCNRKLRWKAQSRAKEVSLWPVLSLNMVIKIISSIIASDGENSLNISRACMINKKVKVHFV